MKLYLSLITIFLSLASFSQEFTVKGKIVDKKNQAVDFAEIYLLSKDSVVLKEEFTDENGDFNILSDKGKYLLQVKQLGELLYNKNIEVLQDTDLGAIQIKTSKEIEAVSVEGKKKLIERKVDRLVFNVENSISASGGDALDALKVTPGVTVQNDKISLIGKSGMAVMVDDRLIQLSGDDLVNYLKTIPSDNIQSIEVITTPPAKYSAEGNSGLINIKLKQVKKDSWNGYLNGSYKQAEYAVFNENIGLNLNYKKTTINLNLSHWDGINYSQTEKKAIYFSEETIKSKDMLKSKVKDNFYGNFGIDYQFSRNFSSGMQFIYNNFDQFIKEDSDQYFYTTINNNVLSKTNSNGISKKENFNFNFNSQYKLDSLGGKMMFNIDYFNYNTNRDRLFLSKNYLNFQDYISDQDYSAKNTSDQRISNISGNIDGEQFINKLKLGYGVKIARTETSSDLRYYEMINKTPVLQVDKSNTFKYKENIQSVYLSGNSKIGNRWEIQLGLRLESTQSKGTSLTLNETQDYNYTKLFSTLYVLYNIGENDKINISYTKRVNRPSYTSLNPFVRYINQNVTTSGNPYLNPSFSNNLEISYLKNNNWNISIYFYQAKDVIKRVNYLNENNAIYLVTKYENCCTEYSLGLNQNYKLRKLSWIESYFSTALYYRENKSDISSFRSNNSISAYFGINNNIVINKNKTLSFAVNYWLNLPEYIGIDKVSTTSNLGLGLIGTFWDKRLVLTLYANDIFKTSKINYITYFNGTQSNFSNYEFTQSVRFSMRYNIGNKNIKSKSVKYGNEEERKRAD